MNLKNRHILFVIPVLTGGGAERVVSVLSSGMAERGYRISLLLNKRVENEYPLSSKVELYTLPEKYGKPGNIIHKIKKTCVRYKIIKSINPDIIIPFLHGVVEPTYICNLFLKKKFVDTIRVNPYIDDVDNLKIRDFIVAHSDACFVQTNEQRRYFPENIQKKCFVVANPISENFFIDKGKKEKDSLRIITAGRLVKQKNHILLIRAIKKLYKDKKDIEVIIYGDGPEKENIQKEIDKLDLTSNIILGGRSENMVEAYQKADIFVLTSDFEGMPNALMEAMASGLACISTDCPTGPKDLIEDKKDGLLVPVGDVDSLEQAIRLLVENQDLRNSISNAAKIKMRTGYTVESIVKRFDEELTRSLQ